jgi:flagella basal body P-ring formation protein FlgA
MRAIEKTGAKGSDSRMRLMIWALITSVVYCQAFGYAQSNEGQKDSVLQVYLPREITIENDRIRLGEIGIVRGQEALAAKARDVALGQISLPGQKVVVNRSVVLSRLVCSGIPASKVKLTGAETTAVMRRQQIVTSSEFIEKAGSFLSANLPAGSVCEMQPVRFPKDLLVPGTNADVKFSPRLVRSGARNQARVQVTVLAGGRPIGTREAVFRLKYNCRRAIALVDIPVGSTISAENVRIEKVPSNEPESASWRSPYGLIAKRRIAAGAVVSPYMAGPDKPPLLLKRNQTVMVRITRPGLLVTAIGKVLQDGHAGEFVRVQNVDSKRTILAKVKEDGTVEPVL